MAGIPNLDIPRLQDLLSEPIDDLTAPHRERVQGFFSNFDHTLSQNKTSIENSIGNIVRAQFWLAEQCHPFIHELVASQSRDTNIPGDTSRTMHTLSDHDTRESGHCISPSMPGKLLFLLINTLSHPMSYCYISNIVTPFSIYAQVIRFILMVPLFLLVLYSRARLMNNHSFATLLVLSTSPVACF
jgi:hypothetical protein